MSRIRMTTLLISLCPLIHIFTSFLEHNFSTLCNILMILGRIIEQVSAVSRERMATLLIFVFELCPLIHILLSFLEHKFATV